MTTFTVQANTTVNSDQMFGPLGFGDLEQVFGSATNTTILGGGLQEVFFGGLARAHQATGRRGRRVGADPGRRFD